MTTIKNFLYISLIAAIVTVSISLYKVLESTNQAIVKLQASISALEKSIHSTEDIVAKNPRGVIGVLENTNAMLIQVGLTSNELRLASGEQRKYWKEMSKQGIGALRETNKTLNEATDMLKDIRKIAASTDKRIGDTVIPEIALTLGSSRDLMAQAAKSIAVTESQVAVLAQDAHVIASDPSILKSLGNIEKATANTNQTTVHISETTGYIRDAFKPTKKGFWENIVSTLIPIGIRTFIPQRTVVTNFGAAGAKEAAR